jgi:hypothetical protein
MEFENLYVRTVQYLRTLPGGSIPVQSLGDMNSYRLLRRSNNVTAVMLSVENGKEISQEDKDTGEAMPLQWALENAPDSLRDGLVSWVTFKYELNPATILIQKGESLKEIRELCYLRLVREITRKKRLAELEAALKKAREIADNAAISEGRTKEDFLTQVG